MKVSLVLDESVSSIKMLHEGHIDEIVKKYNITQRGPQSTGLDEKKGIWYGWSHRALCGFKVGDKLFDENYTDGDKNLDNVKFTDRGSKTCKTLDDCKQAAANFSSYVS